MSCESSADVSGWGKRVAVTLVCVAIAAQIASHVVGEDSTSINRSAVGIVQGEEATAEGVGAARAVEAPSWRPIQCKTGGDLLGVVAVETCKRIAQSNASDLMSTLCRRVVTASPATVPKVVGCLNWAGGRFQKSLQSVFNSTDVPATLCEPQQVNLLLQTHTTYESHASNATIPFYVDGFNFLRHKQCHLISANKARDEMVPKTFRPKDAKDNFVQYAQRVELLRSFMFEVIMNLRRHLLKKKSAKRADGPLQIVFYGDSMIRQLFSRFVSLSRGHRTFQTTADYTAAADGTDTTLEVNEMVHQQHFWDMTYVIFNDGDSLLDERSRPMPPSVFKSASKKAPRRPLVLGQRASERFPTALLAVSYITYQDVQREAVKKALWEDDSVVAFITGLGYWHRKPEDGKHKLHEYIDSHLRYMTAATMARFFWVTAPHSMHYTIDPDTVRMFEERNQESFDYLKSLMPKFWNRLSWIPFGEISRGSGAHLRPADYLHHTCQWSPSAPFTASKFDFGLTNLSYYGGQRQAALLRECGHCLPFCRAEMNLFALEILLVQLSTVRL